VHDEELVLAAVVEPFVDTVRLPDGVKVHTNGVGRRNNGTGDDDVAIQQGPGTGSRMPSMSTGEAARKAVMKQVVAVSKVGNITLDVWFAILSVCESRKSHGIMGAAIVVERPC
jgi:hypothetical protein